MVDYCYIALLINDRFIMKKGKVLDKVLEYESSAYYNVEIQGTTYMVKDTHIFFDIDACISYISRANKD